MKVTIVYESMFGNTHEVAQAIGGGVREAHRTLISNVFPSERARPRSARRTYWLLAGPLLSAA